MALQTREQHIRRDKATSNICTAQALLAVMASMYAVYHGPAGLSKIAGDIHDKAVFVSKQLTAAGWTQKNTTFFDTLLIDAGGRGEEVRRNAEAAHINLRYHVDGHIGISMSEGDTAESIHALLRVFGIDAQYAHAGSNVLGEHARKTDILVHDVFNRYHSETEMMRYLKRLENKDLSLTHAMIALGSCTMKLNAASELMPITWPEFANLHPFAPVEQAAGFH